MDKIIYELGYIQSLLEEAEEYGLLSEVVMFALKSVKEDPNMSESEAITHGYNEWIK